MAKIKEYKQRSINDHQLISLLKKYELRGVGK